MSGLKTLIIPFIVTDEVSFQLAICYDKIRFFAQHGTLIKNEEPYTIDSPYDYFDLFDEKGISRIKYVQNGDLLYLFHEKYIPKIIKRMDNTQWEIEDFEFIGAPYQTPNTENILLYPKATTGQTELWNALAIPVFTRDMIGKYIRLTMKNNPYKEWVSDHSYSANVTVYSDGKYYKSTASGTSGTIKPVHTSGVVSDGGVNWQYIHSGYGEAKIVSYNNESSVIIDIISEMPQYLIDAGTDYWELSVFGGVNCKYPMDGCFFRNRLALLANTNSISTVYMSCSDDYTNFADKDYGEVLATNAITVPLVSGEYNIPCWIYSSSVLFVGCSMAEFYIDSASSAEAIAPDNVKNQLISRIGSVSIKPVKIGAEILFVSKNGVGIHDILYSWAKDEYEAIEVSFFAKHLLSSGVVDMVFQELPDKIIWLAMTNGDLVGITYNVEQKVCAFHRNNLGGKVESLSVIPNPDCLYDDLWLSINRTINNQEFRSIEWLDNGYPIEYPEEITSEKDYYKRTALEEEYTKQQAFYVDGGLTLERDFNSQGVVTLEGNAITISVTIDDTEIINKDTFSQFNYFDVNFISNKTIYIRVKNDKNALFVWNVPKELLGATLSRQEYNERGGVTYNITTPIQSTKFTTAVQPDTSSFLYTIKNLKFSTDNVVVSNLNHLEGKEVAIMADGAELERQMVKNGSVSVPRKYKNITVGLPIDSSFIPQNIYLQGNNSSGIGDVQRIDHVTLMLWRSMGGKVGTNNKDLQAIYFRKTDDVMGESSDLYTGNKTIPLSFNTTTIKEKGATVMIQNDSVYPMNILAIAPHFSTSGNGL